MDLQFNSVEEVIADNYFRAWYFKNDESKARQWELWLLQNEQYVPMVQQGISLMNDMNIREKNVSPDQVQEAYQKLERFLNAAPVVEMKPRKNRWWMTAAAAAVLLLIAGFAYWNTMANNKTTLGAAYGSIREYKLPDGSHVTLNANSEIVVSKEWQKGTDREVWLKGEAFFKVQKTPAKNKFIVHANNMDIIVTGTQFNVISREEESSVLLTEGSVTLKTPDGKEVYMKPGDFVKLENNAPAKKPADEERILAWKQSKLDFENTPMNEVAKIISRHYGIKVSLENSTVGEKKISGMMPNDNLDVLIEALEATGEYKIAKANNEIIISGL
ncbi:MAG: FecR family protein [Flavisolibacter sp.]